jgi:hypothetical protein
MGRPIGKFVPYGPEYRQLHRLPSGHMILQKYDTVPACRKPKIKKSVGYYNNWTSSRRALTSVPTVRPAKRNRNSVSEREMHYGVLQSNAGTYHFMGQNSFHETKGNPLFGKIGVHQHDGVGDGIVFGREISYAENSEPALGK